MGGVLNIEGFLTSFTNKVFSVKRLDLKSLNKGIVVNIHRDNPLNIRVGAFLVAQNIRVTEGCKVKSLSSLASISIGDYLPNSLLDPHRNHILNSKRVDIQYK